MKYLIILFVIMKVPNMRVMNDLPNEPKETINYEPDDILVFIYSNDDDGIEVVCPEVCDNSYPEDEEEKP